MSRGSFPKNMSSEGVFTKNSVSAVFGVLTVKGNSADSIRWLCEVKGNPLSKSGSRTGTRLLAARRIVRVPLVRTCLLMEKAGNESDRRLRITTAMIHPVEVDQLGKRFGARDALSNVTFDVRPGEILGLVGPNGSGKTTLLKTLAGLIRPTSGTVRVFGGDPHRDRVEIMERTRFAFAPPPLFEGLTPREHLSHLGGLHREHPRPTRAEVDLALDQVGLLRRADDRVRTFSFGMKQRLALAQALVPRPDLLVLDEPTDGLDPMAILELREVLKRLNEDHGIAILLSSHLLVEVDELVDRMFVLREGQMLFLGAPGELYQGSRRIRVVTNDPVGATKALEGHGISVSPLLTGPGRAEGAAIWIASDAISLQAAARILASAGVELLQFHDDQPSLERALLMKLETAGPSSEDAAAANTDARNNKAKNAEARNSGAVK